MKFIWNSIKDYILHILLIFGIIILFNQYWNVKYDRNFYNTRMQLQMIKLNDALIEYKKKNWYVPIPDNWIIIEDTKWKELIIQWFAWKKVLNELWLMWSYIHPTEKKHYTYVITMDRKEYWIYVDLIETNLNFVPDYVKYWMLAPILNKEWESINNFYFSRERYRLKDEKFYKIDRRWKLFKVRWKFITKDLLLWIDWIK